MYQLYIANKNYSSWSLRPWVLMRELGIEFEERLQRFIPGSNFEPFRKFSPSGKVPCLVDGATVVWDSLAIAEYLAERHPGVWPKDDRVRAWARSATAEMHSGFGVLRNICSMSCGVRVQLNEISDALKQDINRFDELWCEGLNRFGGPFLAGNTFTAVDAFYAAVVFRVQTYQLKLSQEADEYVYRMLKMPVMQQWYADAIAETFRDAPHDEDILAAGKVIADYRAK